MKNSGVNYDNDAFSSLAFAKQEPEHRLRRVFSSVFISTISKLNLEFCMLSTKNAVRYRA